MSIQFNEPDFNAMKNAIKRAIMRTLKAVALHTQSKVAKYPPRVANKSKYTNYERGRGLIRLRDGFLYKSSELLNRKWRVVNNGATEVVENNASYAAFVHGSTKQASFHAAHGWIKSSTAVQLVNQSGIAERLFNEELRKEGY